MELERSSLLEASASEGTYVATSIDWSQLEPGTFDVKYGFVDAAPLMLSVRAINVGFNVTAEVTPEKSMIGMVADARTNCRWSGLEVDEECIATSNSTIDLRTLGPSEFYTVSVDNAKLARQYASAPDAMVLLEQTQSAKLSRDPIHAKRLRFYMQRVFEKGYPRKGVYGTLVPLLAAALEGFEKNGVSPSRALTRRIAAVRTCETFMREHADETLTLLDFSNVTGLRSRSLINAFYAVTGFSPMHYLRRLRLGGARRDLLCADKSRARVVDVAMSWGFWHLGHFAAEYQAMFGEKPSQTLLNG